MSGVRCCIVGCGPAGAVLGLLLARAGIDVVVLEKHADFLRDFRGDTIHPSTLEILNELGLADEFLELPHTEVARLVMRLPGGDRLDFEFRRLPSRFQFLAFVPQWDFLTFVTREAARYPGFQLVMQAEVEDVIVEAGRVRGVRYSTPDGPQEVRAVLTVGADGRSSRIREATGLPLAETSPPMDVLWFRVSRRLDEPDMIELRLSPGRVVALINRRDYWQVAYVIPKGGFEQVRAAGLEAFRGSVVASVPELADRVAELEDWDAIKLLTVRADRLQRWYARGVLCIGDAAHAMSPIAGVGINIAIQDAVEAANLLWEPLSRGDVTIRQLARVQRRRELAVRFTQGLQRLLQDSIVRPAIASGGVGQRMPKPVVLAMRMPGLRDLPARLIGLGLWRPRVRTPFAAARFAHPSAGRNAAVARRHGGA